MARGRPRGATSGVTIAPKMTREQRSDPHLYVNLLLTALARGHAASVALTAGERPPDPTTLTHDAEDLAGIAAAGLDLDALPSEKIVNLLLEAAGIRRFHLRKTEGHIRAALESHDGASSIEFVFIVTKGISPEGRVQIEIAPRSA